MNRIEQIIGEAILQDTIEIKLRGKVYNIGKPTTSTIIEVSKYVSRFPVIPILKDEKKELEFVLAYAKDCGMLGNLAAVLLLGKKNMITTKKFLGITYKKINNVKILAEVLLDDFSSEELSLITAEALGAQRVGFFLDTITTLNGANLLRKTKVD